MGVASILERTNRRGLTEDSRLGKPSTPVPTVKELLMRKDNSTRTPPVSAQREPYFDEPIRRWSTLPVTQERACELVDLDHEARRHREPGRTHRVDLRADAAHPVVRPVSAVTTSLSAAITFNLRLHARFATIKTVQAVTN